MKSKIHFFMNIFKHFSLQKENKVGLHLYSFTPPQNQNVVLMGNLKFKSSGNI